MEFLFLGIFFWKGVARSGFHFPAFFLLPFGSQALRWRALSGSQYCGADNASLGVIVSMSRWPYLPPTFFTQTPGPRKWFLLLLPANRIGSSYISQQFPFGHIVRLCDVALFQGFFHVALIYCRFFFAK